MTLGDLIKSYRNEHSLSMDKFSDLSGISKAYISLLEKNKHPKTGKPIIPSLQTIKQAANAMDLDFNQLIGMIDSDVSLVPEKKFNTKRGKELTSKDTRNIKKDIDSIMERLTNKEYGPAAYDGKDLSPEAAELFKEELEIALKRLKLINKEKYNPNKQKSR